MKQLLHLSERNKAFGEMEKKIFMMIFLFIVQEIFSFLKEILLKTEFYDWRCCGCYCFFGRRWYWNGNGIMKINYKFFLQKKEKQFVIKSISNKLY